MKPRKLYKVIKRIKLHTQPVRTVDITQSGRFVKETAKWYVFDGFRVRKDTIVSIEENKQ